jgi:GDPmannose 4,6-dehydratase
MSKAARRALITGITGQDGTYLSRLLLAKGYEVVGTSRQNQKAKGTAELRVVNLDLNSPISIDNLIRDFRPDEIYHLAARSSSAQLFDEPIATAHVNGLSVLYFLEAMTRSNSKARFLFASSSEVFALANSSPQNERTCMKPANPYGLAKQFGMSAVDMYRQFKGVHANSAIVFNHESPLRGLHYVSRKITHGAASIYLELNDRLQLGDLDARRDWMHAADAVHAFWLMLQQELPGNYVISSGKLYSVREMCEVAFAYLGLDYRNFVDSRIDPNRRPDITQLYGDNSLAVTTLNWTVQHTFVEMIQEMVRCDLEKLAHKISEI